MSPGGAIFVTNHRKCAAASCFVDKFEGGGTFELLSSFGTGTFSSLSGDTGVTFNSAVGPAGRVYVVNGLDETIQAWEPSAGPTSTPVVEFSVAGSKGDIESINFVKGVHAQIAVSGSGDVYFPNPALHEVQVFSPTGSLEEAIEGTTVGAFSEPRGVAVDSAGDIYVADNSAEAGARVVRIDGLTGTQSELVPKSAGAKAVSVAVDSSNDNVFVGVHGPSPSCGSAECFHVVEYDSAGTLVEEFGAGQIADSTVAKFGITDQLAVDPTTHHVYVTQVEGAEVLVFAQIVLPTATTQAATEVTASAATLNGEVNPSGGETSCYFRWGTTIPYDNTAPCEPEFVGEGINPKAVHAGIMGLEGNTTYHFRLFAETPTGVVVEGEDETLTTPEVPPTVSGAGVEKVTRTDVTLKATINPQHLDTTYWFDYGRLPLTGPDCEPSGPYASAPATPVDLGAGTGPGGVSLDLAGADVVLRNGMESRDLQPNTVYRFQVVAQNPQGRVCSESLFTTLPPAPQAATSAAGGIGQEGATLNGSVVPGGFGSDSDTTYRFLWGEGEAYGGQTPLADAGRGTVPVAVAATLEGLHPNTTYHYRLTASNANADPLADPALAPQVASGADRTFATLPLPPVIAAPGGGTASAVTLNGSVDPTGSPLNCRFEFGPTSAYGQSVPCAEGEAEIGMGEGAVSVHADLSGLAPGATYHYRLLAVGAGGSAASADGSFTVYAPAPAAVTGAASGVGAGAATLGGSVDGHGSVITYRFQYGTTAAYGSTTPASPGAGAVSASLAGLAASTTYHYRLLAISAGGTAYGLDRSFTTAAAPPAAAPAGRPAPAPAHCRKGFVKRHGKCVKKVRAHRRHRKAHRGHHRARHAGSDRGAAGR